MENQSTNVPETEYRPEPELSIDNQIKTYLLETAKWGKFLSIVGFVLTGFMVLLGLGFSTIFSTLSSLSGTETPMPFSFGWFGFIYVLLSLIYFFPSLYLFRFSTKTKKGISSMSQFEMEEAFRNLKSLFKFSGVFTLIFVVLYGVLFGAMAIGGAIGGLMGAFN